MLQELRTSFTDLHKCVTLGLLLAPSKIHSLKKIDGLFTFFLDGISQPYSLITEINQWCMKWPMIDDKSDTLLPNCISYFKFFFVHFQSQAVSSKRVLVYYDSSRIS